MSWIPLQSADQLTQLIAQSASKPQLIFKHSTRCSISSMVLHRLERAGLNDQLDWHLLDLIAHRQLSNQIADHFDVWHESPQVLLIKQGECIFDESHMGIQMAEIVEQAGS
ncbi:bacillithiol system redox-active protein YtxJ [Phnomibacter sp. MR]|uniref:bacillithiol system redox-active protein YtxJ n=1 Tax=Phnomibacter sp. MR TaxID=3042318 RepID=UPI003A80729A